MLTASSLAGIVSTIQQLINGVLNQMSTGLAASRYSVAPATATLADSIATRYSSLQVEIENAELAVTQLQVKDGVAERIADSLQQVHQLQLQASGDLAPEAVAAIQSQIDNTLASIETSLETQLANGNPAFEADEKLQAVLDSGVVATDDSQATLEAMNEVSFQRASTGSDVQAYESNIRMKTSEAISMASSYEQIASINMAMAAVELVQLRTRSMVGISVLSSMLSFEAEFVAQITSGWR